MWVTMMRLAVSRSDGRRGALQPDGRKPDLDAGEDEQDNVQPDHLGLAPAEVKRNPADLDQAGSGRRLMRASAITPSLTGWARGEPRDGVSARWQAGMHGRRLMPW